MKKYKFRIAAYTDSAGKTNPEAPRNGNEDNMFICADLSSIGQDILFSADREESLSKAGCLLVVADGMGGMNAGEVASEIAINVVKESFSPDALQPSVFESPKTRARFMEGVVVRADEAIKSHASRNPECQGMGSTLIMAWLYEKMVTITWCGDSRAYLYRPGVGLKQISKDHSYVQELVDDGKITMDEAFDHPYNNVITRSLGDMSQKAKADSVTIPIFLGDIIMVNSDGLSGVLRDKELETLIGSNRQSMSRCRTALWEAAENADWYDNTTVILCEITDGAEYVLTTEGSLTDVPDNDYFNFRISKKKFKRTLAALSPPLLAAICFMLLRTCHRQDTDNIPEGGCDTTSVQTGTTQSNQESEQPSLEDNMDSLARSKTIDTLSTPATVPADSHSRSQRLTPAGTGDRGILDKILHKIERNSADDKKDRRRLTPVQEDSTTLNPPEKAEAPDTSSVKQQNTI